MTNGTEGALFNMLKLGMSGSDVVDKLTSACVQLFGRYYCVVSKGPKKGAKKSRCEPLESRGPLRDGPVRRYFIYSGACLGGSEPVVSQQLFVGCRFEML